MSGTPLTDAINALTTYANEITGKSDATLSDAVESLVDGYGGGGGAEVYPFYHKQLDIPNATSATPVDIEEVPLPQGWNDDEHLLYYISRYVGEAPSNHYIGSEITGVHGVYSTDGFSFGGVVKKKNTSGQIVYSNGATSGVFPRMSNGKLYVRYIYSANSTFDIGGTYDVKIYLMPKSILKS